MGSDTSVNSKTGLTHEQMREFVRNHFEEFVNCKNLDIADINFAPEFVDHGTDVPPGIPPGPAGAKAYVGGAYKKFPDIHVDILDLIAEGDRVVVRNQWTGTEAATGIKYEFSGIVMANRPPPIGLALGLSHAAQSGKAVVSCTEYSEQFRSIRKRRKSRWMQRRARNLGPLQQAHR
jgi:predicted ester cyclase